MAVANTTLWAPEIIIGVIKIITKHVYRLHATITMIGISQKSILLQGKLDILE
ncbi:MAG: hypothetical protein M3297_02280 [Thermoproteota archaeon]|nr:hypothetical protein [Thermoproteota archaeon]